MTIDRTPAGVPHKIKMREAATRGGLPQASRAWVKDAGPFFVHGHRLSSLYRGGRKRQNPFFVLKILKIDSSTEALASEYLQNKEAGGVRI